MAKKGRAKGGLLIAYHQSKYKSEIIANTENCIFLILVSKDFAFIFGLVYISPSEEIDGFLIKFEELITDISCKCPYLPIYIGGDFNSRVANLNQLSIDAIPENVLVDNERLSCDKKLDTRGRKLVYVMEMNGYVILNGRTTSDYPANFTFLNARGRSTIDLVWSNFLGLYAVLDSQVNYINTNSDHFPIKFELLTKFNKENNKKINATNVSRYKWKKELENKFKLRMSEFLRDSEDFIDGYDMSENLIERICETADGLGIKSKTNFTKNISKPWFDKDCVRCKQDFKCLLIECKKNNFDSAELVVNYIGKKKNIKLYKKLKNMNLKMKY